MHPLRERILDGRTCRHLRTKGLFIPGEEGPPADLPHPADTAAFWCCMSGYALGPDHRPANDRRCSDPARACFEGGAEA